MSQQSEYKKVSELYPELFHYTTASGLQGILSSQSLWATHFEYMNDRDEYQSFFKDELREIIKDAIRPTLERTYQNEEGRKNIDSQGGLYACIENIAFSNRLPEVIQENIHRAFAPYLISFCGGHTNKKHVLRDGLLSQWRGYGTDGGYAIEFDTKEMELLLAKETQTYHFVFNNFCDVNYYDRATGVDIGFPEKMGFKKKLQECIHQFFFEKKDANILWGIFQPVFAIATAQKHSGFAEESEVRIVLIPATKENIKNKQVQTEEGKSLIDYNFVNRNGVLIPYITLFEKQKLPIKRIIVGPHEDSDKRQRAVQMLLAKYEIDAEVTISRIPYIDNKRQN